MKKFILCIFVACGLMMVSDSAESSRIDYDQAVESGRISLEKAGKKSVRQIIREVLDRYKVEKFKIPNTIPIPLYDSLDYDKMKNLA
tara:strand:- start:45 stop:305 length:261 start_codon:yes stop_codon:yes gene_type:complete